MVAKISVGNSLFGALAYNTNKVNESVAKILCSNQIFFQKEKTIDISRSMQDFQNCLPSHYNTKKPVIHISLNPHPSDKLTDDQLTDIAQEYLEKLGYGEQPYIIYKHEDIGRHHIHIVSLRVDKNGQKINDRFEYRRSKTITRELEQKYGLHSAEKQKRAETYLLKKVNPNDGDIKQQISSIIKSLGHYHFQSINEYKSLLSLYNITVDEVRGSIRDKEYNGLIYSVLDRQGNKVGNPFKSSLFGKSVGYNAIQDRCANSKGLIKTKRLREQTKQLITSTMQKQLDRKGFEKELKHQGIDVIFRENDEHRIYGVTFIDHNNTCVFNGSRLGKEFSANSFQEYFSIHHPAIQQEMDNPQEQSSNEAANEQTIEAVASLGGFLSLGGQGINPEEEAFIRKMQRKKRKKGRKI